MAFLKKIAPTEDIEIGFWIMDEPMAFYTEILSQFPDTEKETITDRICNFKAEHRKKEIIAAHALLSKFHPNSFLIEHNKNGAPFCKQANISISHSKQMLCIIISKNKNIAIDIEFPSERVNRILPKFLHADELNFCKNINQSLTMWCAKEVLFKLQKTGNIDFKKNLRVKPFEYSIPLKFSGVIQNNATTKHIDLNHFTEHDFFVVWGTENA